MPLSRSITFSLDLDGYPSPCGAGNNRVGPGGLLDLLEEQLGLPSPSSSSLDRVLAMEVALKTFSDRFFSETFATDPLATARLLLRLRDELVMGGWNETCESSENSRLATLTEVESVFLDKQGSALGVADRIRRLIVTLNDVQPDLAIDCLESRDDLPLLWIKLMDGLKARFIDDSGEKPLADPNSDLGRFQQWLFEGRKKPVKWNNDGTISLSTAYSRVRLEQECAAWIGGINGEDSTVLISNRIELGGIRLWLSGLDQPCPNDRAELIDNPLFQLPGMVLALQWLPFDPQAWIEFLTHPVCPIHAGLRWVLANALGKQPSRSGANCEWAKAIKNWQDKTPIKEREETEFWLGLKPVEKDPTGTQFADLLRRLIKWRGGEGDLDIRFREAVDKLTNGFDREDKLTRLRSQQIIREWQKTLGNQDMASAELDSVTCMSSLAQMTESPDHLGMWLPESFTVGVPVWSFNEVKCLKQQGFKIQDRWAAAKRQDRWLQRKVLGIQKSLSVFRLPQRDGQPQRTPTIQLLLQTCFKGFEIQSTLPEPKAFNETKVVKALQGRLKSITIKKPLLLGSREKESFTSLAKFIQRPDEYVFNYLARWRPGTLKTARAVDNPIARGNLLHGASGEVLEDSSREGEGSRGAALFCHAVNHLANSGHWQTVGSDGAGKWVEDNWDALLEAHASHYLLPENSAARLELRHMTAKAVGYLVHLFNEAGVVKVENETQKEGVAFFGQLGGRLDLCLTNKKGEMAVVDLKLGGYQKRESEIRNSNHLQLALYGHLIGEKTESACSYYILGRAQMISASDNFFGQTAVARSSNDATEWKGCWDRFEQLWKWRQEQLARGEIFMPVWDKKAETGSPISLLSPKSDWPLFSDLKYPGEYRALIGWEVSE